MSMEKRYRTYNRFINSKSQDFLRNFFYLDWKNR